MPTGDFGSAHSPRGTSLPIASFLVVLGLIGIGCCLLCLAIFDRQLQFRLFAAAADLRIVASGFFFVAALVLAQNLLFRPTTLTQLDREPVSEASSRVAVEGMGGSLAGDLPVYRDTSLIALRLSAPKSSSFDFEIPLEEAVERAHRESQGSAAAAFASAFAVKSDDVVEMYATFIAEHVPIYGTIGSSPTVGQVSLSEPLKGFQIEDGALILKDRTGPTVYRNLKIRASDYPLVLEQLISK